MDECVAEDASGAGGRRSCMRGCPSIRGYLATLFLCCIPCVPRCKRAESVSTMPDFDFLFDKTESESETSFEEIIGSSVDTNYEGDNLDQDIILQDFGIPDFDPYMNQNVIYNNHNEYQGHEMNIPDHVYFDNALQVPVDLDYLFQNIDDNQPEMEDNYEDNNIILDEIPYHAMPSDNNFDDANFDHQIAALANAEDITHEQDSDSSTECDPSSSTDLEEQDLDSDAFSTECDISSSNDLEEQNQNNDDDDSSVPYMTAAYRAWHRRVANEKRRAKNVAKYRHRTKMSRKRLYQACKDQDFNPSKIQLVQDNGDYMRSAKRID